MILDPRLAAGLPVNAGAIIGLCMGLFQYSKASDETPRAAWWALYHGGCLMFFTAAASLIFVLPNLGGATFANHMASQAPWFAYGPLFAAVCIALLWLELKLLDRIFRTMGGLKTRLTDRRMLAMTAADLALCLLGAAFIPPQDLPHV